MKKSALLIAIMTIVTSCISAPAAKTENYYTLQTIQSNPVVSAKEITIGLMPADIPSYLDKPQVIVQSDNSAIFQINEKERWIERFGKLVDRAIASDLYTYFPNAIISNPLTDEMSSEYTVSIQINKIIGPLNGTITLESVYTIQNNKTTKSKQKRFVKSETTGPSYIDYADTISKLLNEMVKQIATELTK